MATYKVRIKNEEGKVESRFAIKAKSFDHALKKAKKFWLNLTGNYPKRVEVYSENYPICELLTFDYKLVKVKG